MDARAVIAGSERWTRWKMVAALIVLAVVLGGAVLVTETSERNTRPTPVEEDDVSGPRELSADAKAAARVVRHYFSALAGSSKRFDDRLRASAGDLRAWASWLDKIRGNEFAANELTIRKLKFLEGTSDRMTFAFEAYTSNEEMHEPHRLSGPVEVVNISGAWKVVDYYREGRSQARAVFTKIRNNEQQASSINMRVLGALLQDDSTTLFAEITNTGSAPYNPMAPVLITEHAERVAGGPITTLPIRPGAKRVVGLSWPRGLPVGTRRLRVVIKGPEELNFSSVNFDMTLRLIR
jgi:hypothetical protein